MSRTDMYIVYIGFKVVTHRRYAPYMYIHNTYIYISIYIICILRMQGSKLTHADEMLHIYISIIYMYLYIYVCSEVATHRRDATHISAQFFSFWWSFDPVYSLLSDLYHSDYKNMHITRKLCLSVAQIQNICGTNTSKYFLAGKMNLLMIIFSGYIGLCECSDGKLSTKDW